jgi:hypothetical protein
LFFDRKGVEAAEALSAIFARYPYEWLDGGYEAFYKSHMYTALSTMEHRVTGERITSEGTIDMLVEMSDGNVMVVEAKYRSGTVAENAKAGSGTKQNANAKPKTMDKKSTRAEESADRIRKLLDSGIKSAFSQINERCYAKEFIAAGRNVWFVAVAFAGRTGVRIEFREANSPWAS